MTRTLQPELLDSLPPGHPAAIHNRRDLVLINRLMGNHRWLARTLGTRLQPGEIALELGAGTGELGLTLADRGVATDGLDLWPRPVAWPAGRKWHSTDLRHFSGYAAYPVIFGNLIFHQFSDAHLAELGAEIRRDARLIVACEPARWTIFQHCCRLLGPCLGVNYVTRHDAYVSVAAGFRADELPIALGLAQAGWQCRCHTTAFGAYRMVAVRPQ